MIDVWINNGSGWIIELIESQYINISTYRPLSGRKGLINIKNKDKKRFLWCHVRHINTSKEHAERIKKNDKKIAEELNYDRTEFPVQEKDFNEIEIKNNMYINVFGHDNRLVFLIYISDQKFEDSMDLLLFINNKSHYCTDLCFIKQKKIKNGFVKVFCSVLVVKMC